MYLHLPEGCLIDILIGPQLCRARLFSATCKAKCLQTPLKLDLLSLKLGGGEGYKGESLHQVSV